MITLETRQPAKQPNQIVNGKLRENFRTGVAANQEAASSAPPAIHVCTAACTHDGAGRERK